MDKFKEVYTKMLNEEIVTESDSDEYRKIYKTILKQYQTNNFLKKEIKKIKDTKHQEFMKKLEAYAKQSSTLINDINEAYDNTFKIDMAD